MRLPLFAIPFLLSGACNNTAPAQGVLAQFQNARWPVYQTEVYMPEGGKVLRKTTVRQFVWPNELVSTSESSAEGLTICRTVLSNSEDYQRSECHTAGHKSLSLNSLDASGRIIATVFDPGGGEPVRSGQYEYFGETETFYGYVSGKKDFTVLTEKLPGRKKYTTWVNTDPSAPEIQVQDHHDSGEATELYITAAHGNMRETSRTRVFSGDMQKIWLKYAVSYENPGGLLEITASDWHQSEGILERVYETRTGQFNIDAVADFDEAKSLISSAKLVRSKRITFKPPVA